MGNPDASAALYPAFLRLTGKRVLVVGGGSVAEGKVRALLEAGALITLVAPEILPGLKGDGRLTVHQRAFLPGDLEGVWYCVSAAPAVVNRQVAQAAQTRQCFVNAVDDPQSGSVFLGGVVRKGGATVAISTEGAAPALAGLLREALETVLPDDLTRWVDLAHQVRAEWKTRAVAMAERRPLLLRALNRLYEKRERAA